MRKKILASIMTASMVLSMIPAAPAQKAAADIVTGPVTFEASTEFTEKADDMYFTMVVDGSYISNITTDAEAVYNADVKEVGTADLTTAWWSAFSASYKLPADSTTTFKFHVNGGGSNWNNFVSIFTNEVCESIALPAEQRSADYKEYAVVRSDAWGWGGGENCSVSGTAMVHTHPAATGEISWDSFVATMADADIELTIARSGDTVKMSYKATPGSTTEDPSDEETATKKTMKIKKVVAKKNTKKITGTLSVKKATVKVKVGKAAYKKATVKGKNFTFKTSTLKKGTKVTIKVTKSGYKTVTKTVKVK